jgi:hypothetical protein
MNIVMDRPFYYVSGPTVWQISDGPPNFKIFHTVLWASIGHDSLFSAHYLILELKVVPVLNFFEHRSMMTYGK